MCPVVADLDNWLNEAYRISEPVLRDEQDSHEEPTIPRMH